MTDTEKQQRFENHIKHLAARIGLTPDHPYYDVALSRLRRGEDWRSVRHYLLGDDPAELAGKP